MKTFETTTTIISEIVRREKMKYEAPVCQSHDIELESPILQASAQQFEDGGRYGRNMESWDSLDWKSR